jgi:SAM-dependent methyltransferase
MKKKMTNYGKLLSDYYNGNQNIEQVIKRDDGLKIKVPIKFYFRDIDNLLNTEKDFYDYCKGKILCVGEGTGTHSLILEEKGFDILSIDISEDTCEIMKKRGVRKFSFR